MKFLISDTGGTRETVPCANNNRLLSLRPKSLNESYNKCNFGVTQLSTMYIVDCKLFMYDLELNKAILC